MKYNIDYSGLPVHMQSGTRDYIEHGYEPGGFLTAVICNDLFAAVGRADLVNQKAIVDWVKFFYNKAPAGCWGSRESMEAWMEARRDEDRDAQEQIRLDGDDNDYPG